jgi:NAD(P)-dependent dehydrogenase (short-subunit alcohol dehydrogenase family)
MHRGHDPTQVGAYHQPRLHGGDVGYAAHSACCASKAGLLGLMRCVALEGAPHGISCNTISPG